MAKKTVNVWAKVNGSWGKEPARTVEMGAGDSYESVGRKVMKEVGADEATITLSGHSTCEWESNPT